MNTKLFSLLLALAASVGTLWASDTAVKGIWYDFDSSTQTASVTYKGKDCDSYSGEYTGILTIPSTVTYNKVTYTVTSIGYRAFVDCPDLTFVAIPNSVTNIQKGAFQNCTSLTSVIVPNSVIYIRSAAFYGCTSLTNITIPSSVTTIGDNAFYNCIGLTSITIPNSVTSIGDYVFYGCTGLPVENNLRYADSYLIGAVDKSLSSYTIKEGTKWIAGSAFSGCTNLTSIMIPNSVTSIKVGAFYGCTSLTNITIPNSVTSIGSSAFNGCTSLTNITIPNSVTIISRDAFSGCTGLTSVTIGNSVTSIGESAFYNCTSLISVTCYGTQPPDLDDSFVFYHISSNCILYVLSTSLYSGWKKYFSQILPIGATGADITPNQVKVTPSENTVDVVWPQTANAATYELVIKDKNGNVICTLVFNADGQLTQIEFAAPSRINAPEQAQASGFAFTVTGLNSGTVYDLTLTAKNSSGATLNSRTVSFSTQGPTALEDIVGEASSASVRKVMQNGRLYILRDGKAYTATGQEVK